MRQVISRASVRSLEPALPIQEPMIRLEQRDSQNDELDRSAQRLPCSTDMERSFRETFPDMREVLCNADRMRKSQMEPWRNSFAEPAIHRPTAKTVFLSMKAANWAFHV